MRQRYARFVAVALAALPLWALAQAQLADPIDVAPVFIRLVEASKSVENYQASAVVSARVFGARAQGSDTEYAEFMGYVAATDLTEAKPCLAFLISKHDITEQEAAEVASVYESAIGIRLVELSRELMKYTIERGRLVQPTADGWSDEDKGKLIAIYQTVSFRKFHALATKRSVMEGSLGCYKAVLSLKHPGVKF